MGSLDELAARHGVSAGAVQALQDALHRGNGRMAQFSHPELGGMGQWSAGGMTQVGDMFNASLRDRVAALCAELAAMPADTLAPAASRREWWPAEFGQPSAAGSQDGMRYACFPDARRVVMEQDGAVTVHDSGDHRISGVSQAQGAGQDLVFLSQVGRIRASDLPVVR
ncbi:MAG TPA: hypothetical protein VGC15_14450 [Acetobacteraceae bacterium]